MITLYGAAQGRASRSLICLEELGLAYRHVPLKPWESEADKARLLSLNPNARVGDRYGGPLWPTTPADRARLYQWSIWGQTSIDVMARHRARFGKDPAAKTAAEAERLAALTILDRALADRPYLLGEAFTLADLNLAATLNEPWEQGRIDGDFDPAEHGLPALADWLARCTGRPSWAKVRTIG